MDGRMTAWTWRRAIGTDVTPLMDLTRRHFRFEAINIWSIDEQWFGRCLTVDIVNQFFNPGSTMVAVAESSNGVLLGYTWVERGIKTVWSSEEMIAVKIVHIDLDLPVRQRLKMISEMMDIWELWARSIKVPVICSSTMLVDQSAFIRLHERRGYETRGSTCYLRLEDQD